MGKWRGSGVQGKRLTNVSIYVLRGFDSVRYFDLLKLRNTCLSCQKRLKYPDKAASYALDVFYSIPTGLRLETNIDMFLTFDFSETSVSIPLRVVQARPGQSDLTESAVCVFRRVKICNVIFLAIRAEMG